MSSSLVHTAHVFWLFGLSGAGKSTLAEALAAYLRGRKLPVLELDGDILRAGLCAGLGFAVEDRSENLRRAAEVAKLGLRSHLCVIASFITPLERHRKQVAALIGSAHVSLIHVSATLETCQARDVKQLYKAAASGKVAAMTGITSDFEPAAHADLILQTDREPFADSRERLFAFALNRLQQVS